MQTKTIKKNIITKLNDWLQSITNETLRERVKGHLLVSGGAIASMYLNEPVNDYDIYLQDKNVALDLAIYYTQGMNVIILEGDKREDLVKKLDGDYAWLNLGVTDDEEKEKVCSAYASAVRNLRPGQIKIFNVDTKSGKRFEREKENGSDKEKMYCRSFISPNAISLYDDIQIVLRFTGTAEQIHKTFDFIHPTNYFTFADGIVTNKEAFESLLTKQLRYQGSQYPLTSIIRMKKFVKRGWNIGAGEILKIMYQISELNLNDVDVLEEQLIGVDVAYFGVLIDALREIDKPEKMNSDYVSAIIDKVFNNEEGEE